MCTLIAIHRQVLGTPLVVAANRDEYYDRAAEGLAIRETRVGRVLAPLDARAGGTWLGLNEQGVFAALTNLRSGSPDPGRRSRGEVVLDALGEGSAHAAIERLMERLGPVTAGREGTTAATVLAAETDRETYNPFNLFVADGADAWVLVYRDGAQAEQLEPGVHVIGNVDAIGAPNAKVERVRSEVEAVLAAGETRGPERMQTEREGLLERLASLCRHHEHATEPLSDTCVHVKGTHGKTTYGTRSSMLLELDNDFRAGRLLQADGPPCETKYEDLSFLLHDLGRRSGSGGAEAQVRTAS